MDNKQARYLHQILDRLAEGKNLSPEEIALLRKELPELPKQKTLEEIAWDMDFAWCETSGNDWKEELFGNLETWLSEQHTQLRAHLEGVKSESHPALPAGMRIAEHEDFGRCVVSPSDDEGNYAFRIFYRDEGYVTDSFSRYVESSSLTFIDAEPAHPEFLETEADYKNAPEGTIVACEDSPPWHKFDYVWMSTITCGSNSAENMSGITRRVVRWGWGK